MKNICASILSLPFSGTVGQRTFRRLARLPLLCILPFSLLAQSPNYLWEPSNEGLFGSAVQAFGFAPNGNVLLGTPSGLFILPAGEERWQKGTLNDSLYEFAVTQSGTLLAAASLGTYRSTDNGMTWTNVFFGSGQVHFVPRPNDIIYATAEGGAFGPPSYYYRSTDDGVTWNTHWITDLAIGGNWIRVNGRDEILLTTDSGLLVSKDYGKTWKQTDLYEKIYHLLTPQPGLVVATTPSGVWHSTDDGTSWTKIDTFVPKNFYDFQIAANGNYYYRIADTADFHGLALTSIERSTDGGMTRSSILERTGINVFAVAPDGTLWAGVDATILRSTDNGGSWKRFDQGLSNVAVKEIAYARSGDLFSLIPGSYHPLSAGGELDYNRLYRSSDNGLTWKQFRDSINTFLKVPPYNRLFVGYDVVTWKKGVPVPESSVERHIDLSTNNGQSWQDVAQGDRLVEYAYNSNGTIAFNFRQHLPSGTEGGKLIFTSDSGVSWINLSDPGKAWASTPDGKPIRSLAVLPDGELLISLYDEEDSTFANPELYRVGKDGTTATLLNDSLAFAGLSVTSSGALVGSGFFVTPDSAKGYGYGLYRSIDRGTSWSPVGIFVDPHTYSFEPGENGLLFAVSNDTATLRSTDDGETWKAISPAFISTFVYHPSGSIFGLNGKQPFYTVNVGKNWFAFTNGFPGRSGTSLAITPTGDLFCGTDKHGVYRVKILSAVDEEASQTGAKGTLSILESGSGEQTVSFTLPSPGTTSLALYDLLGREITSLFNQRMEAGTYRLPLDISDLQSGTYVLVMKTEHEVISTKIIVP